MTRPSVVALYPLTWRDVARVRRWRNESRRWFHDSRYVTWPRHLRWWLGYRWRDVGLAMRDRCFVIRYDGQPVGHVAVYDYVSAGDASRIQFGRLVIAPEWRRKGIAEAATRRLVDWVFEWFGVQHIWLTVTADNEAACRLYEKVGFVKSAPLAGQRLLTLTKDSWMATSGRYGG
jgi:RimJ/RimL family protein N-acetyltransferase